MKNIIQQQAKRIATLIVLVAGCFAAAHAQNDVLLSQQWFSRLNRNPAAAGLEKGSVNIGMFYRNQWSIDDALNSGIFNADMYVDSWKSNIGASVSYDQTGPANQSVNAVLAYAFRFAITEKLQLSLGLSGGMFNSSYDPSRLTLDEVVDPGMDYNKESSTRADFNFGTELTSDRLTIGLSMTHLGNNTAGTTETWRSMQQVYAYGRYFIPVAHQFDLAPSVAYVHYDDGNLFEIGATGFLQRKYWLGAAWRPDASAVFMLGLDISMFSLGYAYDISLGDAGNVGNGSHEILLRVKIPTSKKQ